MKNKSTTNHVTSPLRLINPRKLWAIEDELIDIPLQYRDKYWNELLESYNEDLT